MKIRYYPETDTLYIELLAIPGSDVTVISDDIRIDVDTRGQAVGIDIDNASRYYDVNNLETTGIASVRLDITPQPIT